MREWLKKAFDVVVDEACHQVAHGAHEAGALLFNGSAFVMYPHAGKDDPNHGLPQEVKAPEPAQIEQGREM